jgi:hypothetical protein
MRRAGRRGSLRPGARRQHERHGGQGLACRPAQARGTPSSPPARILEVPLADITREIKKNRGDPVTPVTVRDAVNENEVHYLLEHQSEFPGMTITNTLSGTTRSALSRRTSSATSARSRRAS